MTTYPLTIFVYGPCCLCTQKYDCVGGGGRGSKGRQTMSLQDCMLLISRNASRLPQLLSAFTALVFGFHLQRKGGGGGEGGGQGRKTTSMPHCNVSGGGGEGGWQENKTTPMVNCNCSFRDQNRRHARDFYTTSNGVTRSAQKLYTT